MAPAPAAGGAAEAEAEVGAEAEVVEAEAELAVSARSLLAMAYLLQSVRQSLHAPRPNKAEALHNLAEVESIPTFAPASSNGDAVVRALVAFAP
jgi:hypothetical protein